MASLRDFELRTLPALHQQRASTPRLLMFAAHTHEEAEAWQAALRAALWQALGEMPAPYDLAPQMLSTTMREDIQQDLIVLHVQAGVSMPCYILTPPKPRGTLIALHGHGTWGARSLIGLADTPTEAKFIREFRGDYAWQLVQHGYRVIVPVLRGFAERMEGTAEEVQKRLNGEEMWHSSCQPLSLRTLLCGQTLLGLRVWDVQCLIAYLHTQPGIDREHLGCVGFSGGGTLTLYSAALLPDITCAYISGGLNTFEHSLLSIDHCACNYVPGLAQKAEMSDVAGLIAPRPLFIEAGRHDPIYPVAGVEAALRDLEGMYRVWEADSHLAHDIFEGAHRWHGEQAAAWFERWL